MPNPFTVLGIVETADDDAIKKAYLQKVREHPPERDAERFQTIRAAYEAIKTRRDCLNYRLFQRETPDLAELVANALQMSPRRPPQQAAAPASPERAPDRPQEWFFQMTRGSNQITNRDSNTSILSDHRRASFQSTAMTDSESS